MAAGKRKAPVKKAEKAPRLPKNAQPGSPLLLGVDWDWLKVCDEIEERYLLVGADIPLKDLLDDPYKAPDGKLWNLPNAAQFYKATLAHPVVKNRWIQIKQLRSLALSDDAFSVMRRFDPIIETDKGIVPNTVGVQFGRMQLDHYRWMMTRLNPDEFGDKQKVEHSGTVGTNWSELFETEGAPTPKGSGS